MNRFLYGCSGILLALGLAACEESTVNADNGNATSAASKGDDVGEVSSSGTAGDSGEILTFEDLPNCSANREGEKKFVEGDGLTYVCSSGKWVKYNSIIDSVETADELPACISKLEGDSAYVASEMRYFVCTSKEWQKKEVLMQVYKTSDDLPNCAGKYEGVSSYVTEEELIYVCLDGRWTKFVTVYDSEELLPNCSENRNGETAYIRNGNAQMTCSDGKWVDGFVSVNQPSSSSVIPPVSSSAAAPEVSSSSLAIVIPSSASVVPSSSSTRSSSSMSSSSLANSSSSAASTTKPLCGDLWCGRDGDVRVMTLLDDGTDTYGYWFYYNDNNVEFDGGPGSSYIEWPVPMENDDAIIDDPIIDYCGGLCGTAHFEGTYKYPFVGIGFNVSGAKQEANDLTSWKGLCLTYKTYGLSRAVIELAPKYAEKMTAYNNPVYRLKESTVGAETLNLLWSDFAQEEGWGTEVDISVVITNISQIKIKMMDDAGTYGDFNIISLGRYGSCTK